MKMENPINNPGEVSLADIIRTLVQRKEIILISVSVTLFATLVINFLMKPTYRATAKILVKEERLDPSLILPRYEGLSPLQEAQVIKSKPIISKALEKITSSNQLTKQENNPILNVDSVQRNVSVDVIHRTNILELKVDHENPAVVASLANAIAEAYVDYQSSNKTKLINKALYALDTETKVEEGQLRRAEKALDDFSRKEGVAILPETEIVADLQRYAGFDVAITGIDVEIKKIETKLKEIEKEVNSNRPEELTLAFIIENPVIKNLEDKLRTAEIKLSDLQVEYTPEHPEVVGTQKLIEKLKSELEVERPKVIAAEIGSYKMQKKLLQAKKGVLVVANSSYGMRLNKVLFSQPKLSQLLDDVRRRRNIYQGLLSRQRDLRIYKARSESLPNTKIVETAKVPSRPIKPNTLLNGFLGLIVGLVGGITLALLFPVSITKEKEKEVVRRRELAEYWTGKERREMIRLAVALEVIYNVLGRPEMKYKCTSGNISATGIRLITDKKLNKASIIEMSIDIPELGTIYSNGRVIWVSEVGLRENGTGPFSAGVQFIDIFPGDKRKISEYVCKHVALSRK